MKSTLSDQQHFPIHHAVDIAAARRCGRQMATALGFDETRAERVAIVITEVATNIFKHAQDGRVLISTISEGPAKGIEILALDKGPGIANFPQAQRDGVSTTGTAGTGLGAVQRLADYFCVYSRSGLGSAFMMQIWNGNRPAKAAEAAIEYGAVCVPLAGETACGDGWKVVMHGETASVLVVDGLGHGPEAAVAAAAALDTLDLSTARELAQHMESAHTALRVTRGAALAIAKLNFADNSVSLCGIGNISASVANGAQRKQLISQSGIVGHNLRRPNTYSATCGPGDFFIMASDGIGTQWHLENYPGLSSCHPSLVAGVIFRDFCRGRDDATVLAVRHSVAHHEPACIH